MRVYADTSVLLASFNPRDIFAVPVGRWFEDRDVELFWNLILRAELRHNLRFVPPPSSATAWQAYRVAENTRRLVLHTRNTADLIAWGDELSAKFPGLTAVGTWDCVHVAAALRLGAEIFLTCDSAQAELAELAKLPAVHLFR